MKLMRKPVNGREEKGEGGRITFLAAVPFHAQFTEDDPRSRPWREVFAWLLLHAVSSEKKKKKKTGRALSPCREASRGLWYNQWQITSIERPLIIWRGPKRFPFLQDRKEIPPAIRFISRFDICDSRLPSRLRLPCTYYYHARTESWTKAFACRACAKDFYLSILFCTVSPFVFNAAARPFVFIYLFINSFTYLFSKSTFILKNSNSLWIRFFLKIFRSSS